MNRAPVTSSPDLVDYLTASQLLEVDAVKTAWMVGADRIPPRTPSQPSRVPSGIGLVGRASKTRTDPFSSSPSLVPPLSASQLLEAQLFMSMVGPLKKPPSQTTQGQSIPPLAKDAKPEIKVKTEMNEES